MVIVIEKDFEEIGWEFDNTYSRLPKFMISKLFPEKSRSPKLVVFNYDLANELGLDFSSLDDERLAVLFSGNFLPKGSSFLSQAYAGHQFGHFTMLGDGRALLIGEHVTKNKNRFDVQLKGSGKTPYSRQGDGKAALGPVLREFIVSEAMSSLGVPTTRSLAAVSTGESVIRDVPLPGAILTRVASSHIRVGTFQYLAMKGDLESLKLFLDYTIKRHYPNIPNNKNQAIELLKKVMLAQADLIVEWIRVGFVHGVMNTDNVAVSGETIDYGPCAFIDSYDPDKVFSSIDGQGRYAFSNQPSIAHWNLCRFAETLLPIIDKNKKKSIDVAGEVVGEFGDIYKKKWLNMMKNKLGILGEDTGDLSLINELLSLMSRKGADYTNTFYSLTYKDFSNQEFFQCDDFFSWQKKWASRLKSNSKRSVDIMSRSNPVIIPRNHIVEGVLNSAYVENSFSFLHDFLKALKTPYEKTLAKSYYSVPPKENEQVYKTFCGT